MVLIWLY